MRAQPTSQHLGRTVKIDTLLLCLRTEKACLLLVQIGLILIAELKIACRQSLKLADDVKTHPGLAVAGKAALEILD